MTEVGECGVKSKSCKRTAAKGMLGKKAGPNWPEKAPVCAAYTCKDLAGLVDTRSTRRSCSVATLGRRYENDLP